MRKFLSILLLACCSAPIWAQQALTNDAVVKMHASGLGDDLLVSTINSQPGSFATSVDDLIALKKAGLSDRVMGAMIVKNGSGAAAPTAAAQASGAPASAAAADPNAKPRVFLDSASKGTNQNAARDQSMEMSKDFERDCPGVRISVNQSNADYTVLLNHIEVGFVRDNQFQIADKNGDLISKTKEGGSIAGGVKKACTFILNDWATKPH
jgi:hypothetical protein